MHNIHVYSSDSRCRDASRRRATRGTARCRVTGCSTASCWTRRRRRRRAALAGPTPAPPGGRRWCSGRAPSRTWCGRCASFRRTSCACARTTRTGTATGAARRTSTSRSVTLGGGREGCLGGWGGADMLRWLQEQPLQYWRG